MPSERIFPLDPDTIQLFALKGLQVDGGTPKVCNANGVNVRRVIQLINDFSKKPFDQLRILDLACGEGVYAIEAALRSAEVKALDGRIERMSEGIKAAERLNLRNLLFEQTDVRNVNINSHGSVDIVLFLGILYHLDEKDVFPVLKNIYEMCNQFVIIDTHISLNGLISIENNGKTYQGKHWREHADDDPEELRRSRLQSSLDNPLSFWFTKKSLFKLLKDVGFTSVCECNVPLEPFKSVDRITVIAVKGEPVKVSSYPWVNDKTEDEIEHLLSDTLQATQKYGVVKRRFRQLVKSIANRTLRTFGLEIRRI